MNFIKTYKFHKKLNIYLSTKRMLLEVCNITSLLASCLPRMDFKVNEISRMKDMCTPDSNALFNTSNSRQLSCHYS